MFIHNLILPIDYIYRVDIVYFTNKKKASIYDQTSFFDDKMQHKKSNKISYNFNYYL